MNRLSNHRPQRAPVLLLITAQWLLVASAAQADDSVPLSAKATSIVGSARYEDRNHPNWTGLRVGDQLGRDPVLQTNIRDSTADIEVTGSDRGGRGAIRMFSNTVLRQIRLSSKKSDSVEARDILLDMPAGQIRISLDGVSAYAFTLINGSSPIRVTVPRRVAGPKETVFVFNGSLTVLKGAVTASTGTGAEKVIQAGEQLRSGANEVTKTPPEAPELKLGQ